MVLKRHGGAYGVEARVRRNDGTRADTGFFPISDGPHFLEFDWQRATGPGAGDGSFERWIDNVSLATLGALDNDQSEVDFVRMGALSVKTGAGDTLSSTSSSPVGETTSGRNPSTAPPPNLYSRGSDRKGECGAEAEGLVPRSFHLSERVLQDLGLRLIGAE